MSLFDSKILILSLLKFLNISMGYRISPTSITKQQLCLTEACIETSNQLFKSMDRSVDPCQDFNKFVCGRFIKDTIIPGKQQQVDLTTTILKDVMYDRGQMLMETKSEEMQEFEIDAKVKNFYATCSDVLQRENIGVKPLLDVLEDIGGWPVLTSNGKWFCQ